MAFTECGRIWTPVTVAGVLKSSFGDLLNLYKGIQLGENCLTKSDLPCKKKACQNCWMAMISQVAVDGNTRAGYQITGSFFFFLGGGGGGISQS